MTAHDEQASWYTVRCVFELERTDSGERTYEERVTLWQADSFDQAIRSAESDARAYAQLVDAEYLGLAQSFHLFTNGNVGHGDEVFSLIRDSELAPPDYVDRFFDTGREYQRAVD
jgi:hypothetical protein